MYIKVQRNVHFLICTSKDLSVRLYMQINTKCVFANILICRSFHVYNDTKKRVLFHLYFTGFECAFLCKLIQTADILVHVKLFDGKDKESLKRTDGA